MYFLFSFCILFFLNYQYTVLFWILKTCKETKQKNKKDWCFVSSQSQHSTNCLLFSITPNTTLSYQIPQDDAWKPHFFDALQFEKVYNVDQNTQEQDKQKQQDEEEKSISSEQL